MRLERLKAKSTPKPVLIDELVAARSWDSIADSLEPRSTSCSPLNLSPPPGTLLAPRGTQYVINITPAPGTCIAMASSLPLFSHHVLARSNFHVTSTQPEGQFASCKLCERAVTNRLGDEIIRSHLGDLFCSRDCYASFREESPEARMIRISMIGLPANRPHRRRDNPYHFFIDNPADAKKLRAIWEKSEEWKRLGLQKSAKKSVSGNERAKQKAVRKESVPYFPFSFYD